MLPPRKDAGWTAAAAAAGACGCARVRLQEEAPPPALAVWVAAGVLADPDDTRLPAGARPGFDGQQGARGPGRQLDDADAERPSATSCAASGA